jgi:hypothetical protein
MGYPFRRATWIISLFFLTASVAQGQQAAGLPTDKLEKIEKAITAQMSRLGIPRRLCA